MALGDQGMRVQSDVQQFTDVEAMQALCFRVDVATAEVFAF